MRSRSRAAWVVPCVAGLATVALCDCALLFPLSGLDLADWADAETGGPPGAGGDAADDGGLWPADSGASAEGGLDSDAGHAGGDASVEGGGWGGTDGGVDGPRDGASDGLDLDVRSDDGEAGDVGGADVASDAASLGVGLVAYYLFDEASGTVAGDSSGNGGAATLVGGASFASGLQNNAVTLNGSGQYVAAPSGLLTGQSSFSISVWFRLNASPTWSRIVDFGSSTTSYLFLTPSSDTSTLRFAITVGGYTAEQRVEAPAPPIGGWQHVAFTLGGNVGTLFVNGAQAAQNGSMTLYPASLGTTTHDWLGRSEFARDPFLSGQIDNFRLYDRALSATEVAAIFQQKL